MFEVSDRLGQRPPRHRLRAGKVQILDGLYLVAAARKVMRQFGEVIVLAWGLFPWIGVQEGIARSTTSLVEGGVMTVRFTYRDGSIRIFGAGYWRKGKKI